MKVFITGMAGFLGSRIAQDLLEQGHEVSGCDNLVGGYIENVPERARFHRAGCRDLEKMRELTSGQDIVIHAACTAYEALSVFSPNLVSENTQQIAVTVFAACASSGVRRVINCSSMARYGRQERIPFTEDMVPQPVDPYGVSKLGAEQIGRILSEVHGFEFVNLVPHNIIGAHQKYDDPYRNVAAIMINLMLRGKQPIIYGDGRQRRSFSDVRDILPCFSRSVTLPEAAGQTINIGPDEECITILELAELIADVLNFKRLDPIFADAMPREVRDASCSAEKARRILGYRTTFSLRDSIRDLAQWIEQRGPKPFLYHLDVEIRSRKTPRAWAERQFA